MPKLFDLITVPQLGVTDETIPIKTGFVDVETQVQCNSSLKEYMTSDVKLTGKRRVMLFDSLTEIKSEEPTQPVPEETSFHLLVAGAKTEKVFQPLTTGTEIAVVNIPATTSGTTFINDPFIPELKTSKVIKKNKSDKAVTVSIKNQLKKKARRKLAAVSKRKNR